MAEPLHWRIDRIREDMILDKRWTQHDLAKAAKVNDHTLSRLFRGLSVTTKTVAKVADALGRPLRRYYIRPS